MIDARLIYDGAGAIGRGVSGVGGAMSGYAKLKYEKDLNNDKNKTDIKTHLIDYRKSTDTAKINKDSKIYETDGKVKVAKIDYRKSTDTAKINKDSNKYATDASERNNKRTTYALVSTTDKKTKTQKYVADRNLEGAKVKSKDKKKGSKSPDWLKDAMKRAKTPEEREKLLQEYKKLKTIDDMDI